MEQSPKIERVKVLNEMPEEWQVLRKKVLENFESKIEGLDIERVKNFMEKYGLPVADFIVLGDEDVPKLKELFGKSKIERAFFKGEVGRYMPEINLAFFRRNKSMEKDNGTIFSEGFLVHELAHSAGCSEEYIKRGEEFFVPRMGFGLIEEPKNYGIFLEEGFADMVRGKYIDKYIPKEQWLEIQTETPKDIMGVEVDDKFLFFQDGYVTTSTSAFAAMGLEMLCQKSPDFWWALVEARSGIEKLREIPKLINAIKPGLYMEIQKCESTVQGFIKVLNIIKEAIENAKE